MSAGPGSTAAQAERLSTAHAIATILSRATLLALLIVLPLILTPRDYGALGMILSIAALVAIVAPLEIARGLDRPYAQAPSGEKRAWAGTAWTFLVLALLGFLVVGQVLAGPLCDLILGDRAYLAAFRVALALMAFNGLFHFLQGQCRREERAVEYVLITLVFAFLTFAFSIGLALLIRPPLLGVVVGQALAAALAAALGAAGLKRSFALGIDRAKLRETLRCSLPLVPASLASCLSVHASPLILNGLTSLEDVGLYALALHIGGVAALGVVGVRGAAAPIVMAHQHDSKSRAQHARRFERIVGLGVVACLALGLLAPEFIHYAGNPAFSRAAPLVLLLAPATLMMQMHVVAPGFAVKKRPRWQMWISVFSGAVALVANFALIHFFGITGAAVATLISAAVFILLWFRLSQFLYPVPIRWRSVAVAVLAGALLGGVGQNLAYPGVGAGLLIKGLIVGAATILVIMTGLVPFAPGLGRLRNLRGRPRERSR